MKNYGCEKERRNVCFAHSLWQMVASATTQRVFNSQIKAAQVA